MNISLGFFFLLFEYGYVYKLREKNGVIWLMYGYKIYMLIVVFFKFKVKVKMWINFY